MLTRMKKRHIALLSLLAVLAILSIVYLKNDQRKNGAFIRPYEKERDFHALVSLMNANKYWVSENPDFSPEKMLLTRIPASEPNRKIAADIDVVEADETTAGLIAYYKRTQDQGYIWIVAVDKNFRGRGLGEMLVQQALTRLKEKGARSVILGTRLINKPALALYKKLGFVEEYREEERGMVTLIKKNL